MTERQILLSNLDQIHTTPMGVDRIRRNLKLADNEAVEFCKSKISDTRCDISKQGKNFYCKIDGIVITVNSFSYTIITAHQER